jgi:hypothetical protein
LHSLGKPSSRGSCAHLSNICIAVSNAYRCIPSVQFNIVWSGVIPPNSLFVMLPWRRHSENSRLSSSELSFLFVTIVILTTVILRVSRQCYCVASLGCVKQSTHHPLTLIRYPFEVPLLTDLVDGVPAHAAAYKVNKPSDFITKSHCRQTKYDGKEDLLVWAVFAETNALLARSRKPRPAILWLFVLYRRGSTSHTPKHPLHLAEAKLHISLRVG